MNDFKFDLLWYDARANADDHRELVRQRTRAIEDHDRIQEALATSDGVSELVFEAVEKFLSGQSDE